MSPERFHYLFQRYRDNILSQEEWDELRPVLKSGMYDEFLKEDLLQLMRPSGASGHRGKPIVRLLRITAVAAAVLLCVGLLWMLRWSPGQRTRSLAGPPPKAILPGGNKAILTLSNGEQIVLDSTPNGKIARQGVTTIIRAGGQIGYNTGVTQGITTDRTGEDTALVFYNTVSTPKGGQYEIVLADGSKVWLNSASSLRFPTLFKGNERSVELRGEGYFEVEKDATKPFSVSVGKMKVQVLGTRFNTMAYADEETINTTLLDGAVAIHDGPEVQQLLPGQQVALGADHRMGVRPADIEKTMAWKNGFFEFDRMDLAAIMRQIARWYDVEIVYLETPDHTSLGGSISKNLGLAEVLNLLEASGSVHFKIEGRKVYITQTK